MGRRIDHSSANRSLDPTYILVVMDFFCATWKGCCEVGVGQVYTMSKAQTLRFRTLQTRSIGKLFIIGYGLQNEVSVLTRRAHSSAASLICRCDMGPLNLTDPVTQPGSWTVENCTSTLISCTKELRLGARTLMRWVERGISNQEE